jgi:hypothetical protein
MFVAKSKIVIFGVLGFCAAAWALAGSAVAQDKERPKEKPGQRDGESPVVRGLIKSVEQGKIVITLQRDGGKAEDKTLALAKTVKVHVGEKEGTVADLKTGMRAEAKLSPDQKEVVAIRIAPVRPAPKGEKEKDRAGVRGIFKEVKGNKIVITIQRDGAQAQDKEYALAKEVRVSVPGKEAAAQITDLRPGAQVLLTLSEDQREVVSVREFPRRKEQ